MKVMFCLCTALFVFGCSNAPSGVRAKASSVLAPSISANSCQENQLSSRITSLTGNDTDFRQRVGDLVSVSLNPADLGDISGAMSGSTGVDLSMTLVFDSSHQVVSNLSKFKILIKDSLVGTIGSDGQVIQPVSVLHSGASQLTGSFEPSQRSLQLQYSDSFGQVLLAGQIQGDQFKGQVQFKNSVSWDGSSPRQGVLGQIQATACTFQ